MTTHRHIQIHNLLDTAAVRAEGCRAAASNLARIRNDRAAGYYIRRADRFVRIAARCAARLAAP